jgi:hypothetical protein
VVHNELLDEQILLLLTSARRVADSETVHPKAVGGLAYGIC